MRRPVDEQLVELTTTVNETEAGVLRAVLESEGIESWQYAADGASLGVFGASLLTPTRVMVRRSQAAEARRRLDARREDSVDLDWNEVDVGEPADELARRISQRADAGGRAIRRYAVPRAAAIVVILLAVMLLTGPIGLLAGLLVLGLLAFGRLGRRFEGGPS